MANDVPIKCSVTTISYREFSHTALYGPSGYYRAEKTRVGYAGADFYTSSSLKLFPRLMAAALHTLAQENNLDSPTLVELAAEPGRGLWPQVPEGFAASRTFGLGDELQLPTTPCIIFANELLDAMSFGRYRFTNGTWTELGIDLASRTLDLPLDKASDTIFRHLPMVADEGATIDFSLAALDFLTRLASTPWRGLLVLADYGLPTAALLERPNGTARAYHQHKLLGFAEALPLPLGSYDITHHVPWEIVTAHLQTLGLTVAPLQTQESFIIHHAQGIFPTLSASERRELATLTHPSHMGEKFQVLVAQKKA